MEGLLRKGSKFPGITEGYGNMVIAPEFVLDRWPKAGFIVDSVIEGIIGHRQDLIVLRRS